VSLVDTGVSREQALEAARADLNFLAMLCVPEIFKYLFPPIFKALWQWITANLAIEKGMQRLAIGLPRGFGKTIFLKLIVVYTILFTDRRFILVVCNTEQLAENFIADVIDVLDSHNIRNLFGNWRLAVEKETLHLKKFHFRGRPIILAAIGAGSSPRGLNIKFVRPDFIIMDDMQSKEQAESAVEAIRTLSWMMGTLMKTNDPERCLYVFVGNMYPYPGSILKKLKNASSWLSFITAAILEDGQSIWPELKPVPVLLAELESDTELGHPEIFYAEVMNDENAGAKHGIDVTLIQPAPDYLLDDQAPAGFVIIDPSVGKKKSDDVAIGAFLVHDKPMFRELVTREDGSMKFDPKEQVRFSIGLCLKYGIRVLFVEAVAYQATLAYWIEHFLKELGIEGIQVIEIYPGTGSKNARIFNTLKTMAKENPDNAEILIHKSVRARFVDQAVAWNPLKTDNKDDVLDLPTYCHKILLEHSGNLMRVMELGTDHGAPRATFTDDLQLAF
jgi:hypothetical protein